MIELRHAAARGRSRRLRGGRVARPRVPSGRATGRGLARLRVGLALTAYRGAANRGAARGRAAMAGHDIPVDREGLAVLDEPGADLRLGLARARDPQPVHVRPRLGRGEYLDHLGVHQLGVQRHDLAVRLRAEAVDTDVRVDREGEVQRRGAGRQLDHVSPRREDEDGVLEELALDLLEVDGALGDEVAPLLEAVDDGEVLGPRGLRAQALLVQPMRGDAVLGDAVHLLRAYLDLEEASLVAHHRRVEAAVAVRLRHRDVVLEAPFHRLPQAVDHSEHGVAVVLGPADEPEAQEVVELLCALGLLSHLLVDRVEVLGSGRSLDLDSFRPRRAEDLGFDAMEEGLALALLDRDDVLDLIEGLAVQGFKREVLELVLQPADAEPVREGREDVEALGGDLLLPLVREVLEGPHAVELVGELDDDDAYVPRHREEHLADRLGRLHGLVLRLEGRQPRAVLDERGTRLARSARR